VVQELHPHLQKMHANARIQRLTDGTAIDWGTAEAMAFGSLLIQASIERFFVQKSNASYCAKEDK
jgi:2-oxoglutarate dehydrogenase complex dehydrogenase (E1) component-like enzyme